MVRRFSGCAISARYRLANTRHSRSVFAERPAVTAAADGDKFGYQTSYQFADANFDLGTPRGGRRTVPIRSPSPAARGVPRRTTRITSRTRRADIPGTAAARRGWHATAP